MTHEAQKEGVVLVTGSTGYIGAPLVKELVSQGYRVRAMTIENDPMLHRLQGVKCDVVHGDITKPKTLHEPLRGVKTVIHLAAVIIADNKNLFFQVNFEGTRNVIEKSVEAGVEHFIGISAAAANYKKRTTYGDAKFEAEKLMKEKSGKMNFTIIRPSLLYGAGGSKEFMMYVDSLRKFSFFAPLIGNGKTRKNMVWHGDVVQGLTKLVGKPIAYGKTYNFSGGSDLSMREITEEIMKYFGIKKIIAPIPVPLCNVAAFFLEKIMKKPMLSRDDIKYVTMDANFSNESARRDIGYQPVSFQEGLKRGFPEPK